MTVVNAVLQAVDSTLNVSITGSAVSVPWSTRLGFDGVAFSPVDVIGGALNAYEAVSSGGNTTPTARGAINIGVFGRK